MTQASKALLSYFDCGPVSGAYLSELRVSRLTGGLRPYLNKSSIGAYLL